MTSIDKLSKNQADKIQFILADIDDTLTEEGRLLPEAFSALWRCNSLGYHVIPVTGRPAGWCDCIARQWPVDGVVGENGALAFYSNGSRLERMFHPSIQPESSRKKLEVIREDVLQNIPGTRVAKDQFARMFDLAIDFAEEEPILPLESAEEIKRTCERHGAVAKISSIHVNTWFGNYDKLSMVLHFLESTWNIGENEAKKKVIFCGDSPNDAPMFSFFPLSCGVGNIRQFEKYLDAEPHFVTEAWYGKGFAEMVNKILSFNSR